MAYPGPKAERERKEEASSVGRREEVVGRRKGVVVGRKKGVVGMVALVGSSKTEREQKEEGVAEEERKREQKEEGVVVGYS